VCVISFKTFLLNQRKNDHSTFGFGDEKTGSLELSSVSNASIAQFLSLR